MTDLTELLSSAAAIVGKIGTGKTYVAKGVVEKLLALGRRVVIIDPTGVWYGLRSGADGSERGGFPVMIFGGDHADVPITDQGGEAVALAIAEREVQCIIDLSDMTNAAKIRFMTPFLEHLYAKNRAALHLIVDEADEIAAQRLADGEHRMFGAFDKIVRRGRVKGFRPLMITQRPAVLHKNVLSQVGTLIALQLTSPQDRKAIEEWVKGNADADQAKEVMSTLPTLQRGEGWVWSPSSDVLERTQFPAITTFDSSRTPEAGEAVVAPALSVVDVEELRAAMASSEPVTGNTLPVSADISREIEAAEKRGYERGLSEGYKRGGTAIEELMNWMVARIGDFSDEVRGQFSHVIGQALLPDRFAEQTTETPTVPAPRMKPRPTMPNVVQLAAEHPGGSLSPSARKIVVAETEDGAAALTGPQQKIIDAIAWWNVSGVAAPTASQVAFIAGYSQSGTWDTYRSRLRSRGLIALDSGRITLTEAGIQAANKPSGRLSASDLHDAVRSKIPGPLVRFLDVLIAAYPDDIDRGEWAVRAGYGATSGTSDTYRSKMSSLDLATSPQRGRARAADWLFPSNST